MIAPRGGMRRLGELIGELPPETWTQRKRARKKKRGPDARKKRAGLEAAAVGAVPFRELSPGYFLAQLELIQGAASLMLQEDSRRDGLPLSPANYARARAITAAARSLVSVLA